MLMGPGKNGFEKDICLAHEVFHYAHYQWRDPVKAPRICIYELEGSQGNFRVLIRVRSGVWPVASVVEDDTGKPVWLDRVHLLFSKLDGRVFRLRLVSNQHHGGNI